MRNRSKPGSEIVHFRDFRHLLRTKAIEGIAQNRVRESFIFIILRYLFRTIARMVRRQSYIMNRSKPDPEVVHFHHFRYLLRTKAT